MKIINTNILITFKLEELKQFYYMYYGMIGKKEVIEDLKANKFNQYLLENNLGVSEEQLEEAIEYLESKV